MDSPSTSAAKSSFICQPSRRLVFRTHLSSFLDGSTSGHSAKAPAKARRFRKSRVSHVSRNAGRSQLFWDFSDSLARRAPRPTVSLRTNATLPVSATLVHRAAHPSRDGSCGSSQPENIRLTRLRAKSFLDRRHFRNPGRIPRRDSAGWVSPIQDCANASPFFPQQQSSACSGDSGTHQSSTSLAQPRPTAKPCRRFSRYSWPPWPQCAS